MRDEEVRITPITSAGRVITREQKAFEDLIDIVADLINTIDAPTDGEQWKLQKLHNRLVDLNTEISEWTNR